MIAHALRIVANELDRHLVALGANGTQVDLANVGDRFAVARLGNSGDDHHLLQVVAPQVADLAKRVDGWFALAVDHPRHGRLGNSGVCC